MTIYNLIILAALCTFVIIFIIQIRKLRTLNIFVKASQIYNSMDLYEIQEITIKERMAAKIFDDESKNSFDQIDQIVSKWKDYMENHFDLKPNYNFQNEYLRRYFLAFFNVHAYEMKLWYFNTRHKSSDVQLLDSTFICLLVIMEQQMEKYINTINPDMLSRNATETLINTSIMMNDIAAGAYNFLNNYMMNTYLYDYLHQYEEKDVFSDEIMTTINEFLNHSIIEKRIVTKELQDLLDPWLMPSDRNYIEKIKKGTVESTNNKYV